MPHNFVSPASLDFWASAGSESSAVRTKQQYPRGKKAQPISKAAWSHSSKQYSLPERGACSLLAPCRSPSGYRSDARGCRQSRSREDQGQVGEEERASDQSSAKFTVIATLGGSTFHSRPGNWSDPLCDWADAPEATNLRRSRDVHTPLSN